MISSIKFQVDAIDLSSGTINSLPPLREARYYASSVVVQEGNNEVLYVLGGSDKSYNNTLSSVEMFVVADILDIKIVLVYLQIDIFIVDGIQ